MVQIPAEHEELSVGQLAARSGVSVSALHFYESQGLISARRTDGNQRRLARQMLRRVAFVRAAQRVGIPLREVKVALDRLEGGRTPTRQDWARLSATWQDDLDDRIHRLVELRDRLTECIGCGCLSIDRCPFANPDDALGQDGPGARNLRP